MCQLMLLVNNVGGTKNMHSENYVSPFCYTQLASLVLVITLCSIAFIIIAAIDIHTSLNIYYVYNI